MPGDSRSPTCRKNRETGGRRTRAPLPPEKWRRPESGRTRNCARAVAPRAQGNPPLRVNRAASSHLLQQGLGVTHFKLARRFKIQSFHHAIFHQHRKALAAHAHPAPSEIEFQAKLARVFSTAIGHHPDLAYRFLIASPSAHDESVVDGKTPDFIDTLRLQRAKIGDIAGYVLGGAGRCECAGQAEYRDLLSLHEIRDFEVIWTDSAGFRLLLNKFTQHAIGQSFANFDRHLILLGLGGWTGPCNGPDRVYSSGQN